MNTLSQFFRFCKPLNLLTMILIVVTVATINIAALYASSSSGYRASNVPQTMRRESAKPVTLEEALDLSLAYGDGRKVDFTPFGLGWEA